MTRQLNFAQLWWAVYDAERKVLTVKFNRVGRYEYKGVPEDVWRGIMSLSPEAAVDLFDNKVEGKYKSTRMGD